ncbi:UNVERIFIED_ORG: hypothetical protein EDF86_0061 [Pseudomonas psychrophila]
MDCEAILKGCPAVRIAASYLVSDYTQSNRARKTRSDAQYAPYRFPQDR